MGGCTRDSSRVSAENPVAPLDPAPPHVLHMILIVMVCDRFSHEASNFLVQGLDEVLFCSLVMSVNLKMHVQDKLLAELPRPLRQEVSSFLGYHLLANCYMFSV